MKTVKEVSKLAGVSVRTLHYYDTIGLLKPTEVTGPGTGCMTIRLWSGFRLYCFSANWNFL